MGIPFGRNGCSTIEVEPFRKICDFTHPAGTTPLSLEVPVPTFAPSVPPTECACFDFKKGSSAITIVTDPAKQKLAKASVEIRQRDDDCCTGRYEIIPLVEIPACTLPDSQNLSTKKIVLDGQGSFIQATLTRQNCDLGIVLTGQVNHPPFPQPCIPKLKTEPFELKATYKDDEGADKESEPAKFTIENIAKPGECPVYEIKGSTLDLRGIGGISFKNGGDVNKNSNNSQLYIDASLGTANTYYGGGYGDTAAGKYSGVDRRDDVMRGAPSAFDGMDVPVTDVKSMLVDDNGVTKRTWTSGITVNADGTKESNGNLNIVMPTGIEWNTYGMALTLSKFKYAANGVLHSVTETGKAALVSPTPAVRVTGSSSSGLGMANVSGLDIFPYGAKELGGAGVKCGLAVDAGAGLRIHGVNDKTPGGLWTGDDVGKLEVQFGGGLHILRGQTDTGAAVFDEGRSDKPGALYVACGDGLKIDNNGRVAIDDDSLAKAHHTHALADGTAETATKKWEITSPHTYSLVFVDGNGKAATKQGDAISYELFRLQAIYKSTTYGRTSNSLSKAYLKTIALSKDSDKVGVDIDGPNSAIALNKPSGTVGVGIDGVNSAITFDGKETTESNIYVRTNGMTVSSKIGVTIESGEKDTMLNKHPTAASTNKESLKVATCGWIAKNFSPTSGLPANRWAVTDSEGHLSTTQDSDSGVLCADSGIRKILPLGELGADGVGIAQLTRDADGAAVIPYEHIPFGDGEENRVATGKHTHGNLNNDGTIEVATTAGNLIVQGDNNELCVFNRFSPPWAKDLDDTAALDKMANVFELDTDGTKLRIPTSRLTYSQVEGDMHSGNCLLMINNSGDVRHSGNAMYDTLKALSSQADATNAPVKYSGGGASAPAYLGLTRHAFGNGVATEAATVIFRKDAEVATLMDGTPITVPTDKKGLIYDNHGEAVVAEAGVGVKVDVTGSGESTTAKVAVNYGRGLHSASCSGSTGSKNEKLELNVTDLDFTFLGDTNSATNAKLSINDTAPKEDAVIPMGGAGTTWCRTNSREIVIPVLVDISTNAAGVISKKFVYLRFLRNGVLLGVHAAANNAGLTVLNIHKINFSAGRSTKKHVTACGT